MGHPHWYARADASGSSIQGHRRPPRPRLYPRRSGGRGPHIRRKCGKVHRDLSDMRSAPSRRRTLSLGMGYSSRLSKPPLQRAASRDGVPKAVLRSGRRRRISHGFVWPKIAAVEQGARVPLSPNLPQPRTLSRARMPGGGATHWLHRLALRAVMWRVVGWTWPSAIRITSSILAIRGWRC